MSTSRKVGVKVGRGLGFVGATLWKGTVMAAEGLGEAGEGFLEGAESGWEDRSKAMDLAQAQRKAKVAAAIAAALAAEAQQAAPIAA